MSAKQLIDDIVEGSNLRPKSPRGRKLIDLALEYGGFYAGFHDRFESYELRFPNPAAADDFVTHATRLKYDASKAIQSRSSRGDWVAYVLKSW